jgi:hypothetical protein
MIRCTSVRSSIWTLGLLAALPSCTNDEPFVGFVSRSRYFEYHNRVDEPLCPTLLDRLDQHAQVIGGKIGLVPDASRKFRYYKFRDEADFAENADCPFEDGCVVNDDVYSAKYFHNHELAHQYVFRAWGGRSVGLLNEGEAVALSCDPLVHVQPDERPRDVLSRSSASLEWREFLNLYGDSRTGYAAAGFFVTYLVEHYGWAKVAELHRRTPPGSSELDFEREFARVFPLSIDSAWSKALDAPGASPCQKDWQCLVTPMKDGDEAAPDCDGEMHRAVVVDDEGGVVFALHGDESVRLLDCTAASPRSYLLEGRLQTDRVTHWASLPPGTYAMFPDLIPRLPRVGLVSMLPPGWVTGGCNSASPVVLDSGAETSLDLLPSELADVARNGENPLSIAIDGGGNPYSVFSYDLAWNDVATAGPLAVCEECGKTGPCVPLPFGQRLSVEIGERAAVRLDQVFSVPPYRRAWGRLVFMPEPSGTANP